jgi:hypothetical protein
MSVSVLFSNRSSIDNKQLVIKIINEGLFFSLKNPHHFFTPSLTLPLGGEGKKFFLSHL